VEYLSNPRAIQKRIFIRSLKYKNSYVNRRTFLEGALLGATPTSLRVEKKERLVSEERSDEFKVFPERRS